ncbi:hypothetical protein HRR83_006448 [Exophiala dermatitidis]|uniref:Bud22 domain-containing protein n=2 Tax=Exophiala dermatitidis TaxID=5970 RepID=H6CAC4_EXODN|nr:uncharacterized protein HMPREF1120_08060 [Exophiala dermatitidis NIH/UT8656]KAJ4503634.1 hypothetical protein HRR75_008028 [Exophiala dermatitidis]EHY60088.1 hypothetical protein HMPREF1120_08060 [Exophiala dermatitidis NIH/UT8656]KAJ4504549.1 hypothetical protein HRR73_008723 [Exophiala dermatitidis]KAJ4505366.1 hypothetical protein HRR74_008737 [Exophiala dermatitidis]KAJ4530647.1 hypothetical protein HRR76_008346 [Exophiala dermatitidis]
MPKRKRQDGGDDEDELQIEDQALRIKVTRLKAKMDQSIKRLHAALKLARGFERQKLGRRQKTASDEPQTLLRLREEVIVLKELQLDQTAKRYLLKHLFRAKRVREHPAFVQVYGTEPAIEPMKSTAEANVLGRLFKSTPVKNVVPEIMKAIYDVLGIPQAGSSDDVEKKPSTLEQNKQTAQSNEDEFHGFSSEQGQSESAAPPDHPERSDSEADRLLSEYAAGRLASSGDEESESGEAAYLRRSEMSNGTSRRDISVSPSPSGSSDHDRRHTSDKSSAPRVTSTAFLPSLSLGGYYSGSESEDEDAPRHRGPPEPKPRKNRRGQRARQQLAELKYGKNAKHLAKQKEKDSRNAGWDPKRGAVGPGDNPRDRSRKGLNAKAPHNPSAGQTQPPRPKPKQRDDQGSLHPSWEAAKKRKMQDQTLPAFAGKKITFD